MKKKSIYIASLSLLVFFILKLQPTNFPLKKATDSKTAKVLTLSSGAQVFMLEKGQVIGRDGDLISQSGEIVLDTSIHSDTHLRSAKSLKGHHLKRKRILPSLNLRPHDTIAVLSAGASNCYYHWMIDVLPKLDSLRKSGINYDWLYLPELKYPFQKEALEVLQIPKDKLIFGTHGTYIEAKEIIGFSLPSERLKAKRYAINFLRKSFISDLDLPTPKKIYISRNLATTRRFRNEDMLYQALQPLGFEKIYLETLSLKEQVWIFKNARVIVAAHGSGLTNIVFCDPKTEVFELMPSSGGTYSYSHLCHELDLNYHALYCEEGDKKEERKSIRSLFKRKKRPLTYQIAPIEALIQKLTHLK